LQIGKFDLGLFSGIMITSDEREATLTKGLEML